MRLLLSLFLMLLLFNCSAQNQVLTNTKTTTTSLNTTPKLVVGIVVDQMRYDYLTRFYSKYYSCVACRYFDKIRSTFVLVLASCRHLYRLDTKNSL